MGAPASSGSGIAPRTLAGVFLTMVALFAATTFLARCLPRVYPDLALDSALRVFGSHPLLPVSSRNRPYTLVGTLTLEDVHRAYGVRFR